MKVIRLLTTLLFIGLSNLHAQQPLGPGSIVLLALQTDSPDAFAFAAMQDIAANDTIYFTDNGWSGTAFFANEQTMRWYSSQLVPKGTVIRISDPLGAESNALVEGAGTALGKLNSLAVGGDQILAYKIATGGGIIHLAGISSRSWQETCSTTGTGNTNSTCLPSGLVNGQTAFSFSNTTTDTDNIFLNVPVISGTPQSILNQINGNNLNWFGSNDTTTGGMSHWPAWQFNFSEPNTASLQFAGSNPLNLIEGTGPQTITMHLSNPLAVATSVTLKVALNGGATTQDFTLIPAAVDSIFQLGFAAGQTSATFTIELHDDGEEETGEGAVISVFSASSELLYTNPTQKEIRFSDLSDIASEINFRTASYTVMEGNQVQVSLLIVPPATQPGNIVLNVSAGNGIEGGDFSTVPTVAGGFINLGISQGADSVSFVFNANDDAFVENAETVSFGIESVSSGFVAGTTISQTVITLEDNDQATTLPELYINEIMSSNTQTIEDQPGEFDDWFELFNPGTEPVDIGGFYVTDDKNNPTKHQFPTGDPATVIPAGGFLLIWADEQVSQGALHVNFKLSANGEFLGIYGDDASTSLIDSVSFPAIAADQSYGRQVDGGTPWRTFISGATTPGASNLTSGVTSTFSSKIQAYPNPANQVLFIEGMHLNTHFKLFDSMGRKLQEGQLQTATNRLEVSGLQAGLYHLSLSVNGGESIGSVIFIKQ